MNRGQLEKEVEREWSEIEHCCFKIEQYAQKLKNSTELLEREMATQAVGLSLHGLYTGTERIFENISKVIDKKPVGKSASWHENLLKQMCQEIPEVRKAIIGKSSFVLLNELRGFRHVVRSRYGNRLNTQKVLDLTAKIPNGYLELGKELKQFIADLPKEIEANKKPNTQNLSSQENRQLYQKYLQQIATNVSRSSEYFTNILQQEQQDLKIARRIIDEFPAGDPMAIVKVRQVISQSNRALYLKQTKDKVEINKYLNTVINKARKIAPGDESQSKSSELDR